MTDADSTSSAAATDRELLERHLPVLKLARGERFRPMRVEPYVELCDLRVPSDSGPKVAVARGDLTINRLAEPWPVGSFLQFVDPAGRRRAAARLTAPNIEWRSEPRLAQVGLTGRIVDALLRFTNVVRPTVPWKTSDAAAVKAAPLQNAEPPCCYGRVTHAGGWIALQYVFFYAMNDWRSTFDGVNDHEADWEQVMLYLDGESCEPVWVAYASHDHSGDDLRRHWTDPELIRQGSRPVIFVAAGSHASYFSAGDYLTSVSAGSRLVVGVQRGLRRLVRLPSDVDGIAIPYLDRAGGGGEEIGPSGDTDLEVYLLDEEEGWVGSFRGMWGLDTDDPADGERAPGGPKFNRDGTIRASWADPIGWAGVHKLIPPSRRDRGENVIESELHRVESELDDHIRRARMLAQSTAIADSDEVRGVEEQITRLSLQRSRLADASRQAVEIADDEDLRAHLVDPATPMAPVENVRGRLRGLWAVISAPLFFATIGMAVLNVGTEGAQILFAGLFWILAIELFTRRRFLRFFGIWVIISITISLFVLFFGLIATGSKETIAAMFLLAGVVTLAANVTERLRE